MALESRITQEEIKKEPEKPIDREKVDKTLFYNLVYVHFKITIARANEAGAEWFQRSRMVDLSAEFLPFVIDNIIVTWLHRPHVVNEGKRDRFNEINSWVESVCALSLARWLTLCGNTSS